MSAHRSETLVIVENDFSLEISLISKEKVTIKSWSDPEAAHECLEFVDKMFLGKTLLKIRENTKFRFSIPNSRDQVRVVRNDGYYAIFKLDTVTLYRPDDFKNDRPPTICTNEHISKEFFDKLTLERNLEIRKALTYLKSIKEIIEKFNGERS